MFLDSIIFTKIYLFSLKYKLRIANIVVVFSNKIIKKIKKLFCIFEKSTIFASLNGQTTIPREFIVGFG